MVQDRQDWSTLTGREVTEYFLLWICSPVKVLCCVPFTCCVGLQSIISGTALGPALIMGMLTVDLGDSQALFTSGHQHKSTEVRSHTALVIHVNPLGKYGGRLDYSLVQLPYYMPTKPTAAKARAVSTAGALVVYLAVPKLLNSGSCQWKCNSEVRAVARRFQLFFGNMNPELSCGFRSNSSCVLSTGICSTGCQSTGTCQAERSQGGDQDEQATQAGGFWGSSWNMRAHQAGGSQEGHWSKQVMGEGSLGRWWWEHRSQLQLEPFLVPMEGGGQWMRQRGCNGGFSSCMSLNSESEGTSLSLLWLSLWWISSLSWGKLSPQSQQQSPSLIFTPNSLSQHRVPVHIGGHLSQAGVHRTVVQTTWTRLTLPCLPRNSCCALLWAPKAPLLPQLISLPVRVLSQFWEPLPTFSFPPGVQVSPPLPLLFLFPSFYFILPSYMGIFLIHLRVWSPLLRLSSCSVGIVPFLDVFLLHLWEMNYTSSHSSTMLNIYMVDF